jgi:hypothetical protein
MEERRKSKAKRRASEGRRYKPTRAGLKTGHYIAASGAGCAAFENGYGARGLGRSYTRFPGI